MEKDKLKNKGFTPTPNLYKKANLVSGFTLIELMVATSIFVMVMLSAMGSLFVLLNAAKNSRALRFSIDNVNFAMESMSRSIRMGTNYYCLSEGESLNLSEGLEKNRDCPEGGTSFAFIPQGVTTSRIAYILKKREDGSGTRTLERCSLDGCVEIVSSNVDIEKLKFFVNGAVDEERQASVYMIMKGTVMVKDVPVPFALQTMASMRNF